MCQGHLRKRGESTTEMTEKTVNITIVTCGRLALTAKTIDSLAKNTDWPHKVTVVDNASTDGTADFLRTARNEGTIHEYIQLERNMGVAVAANLGWAAMDAPYYLKLDNDIELLHKNWLPALVNLASENPILGVAALPVLPVPHENLTKLPSGHEIIQKPHVGGACALIRRDVHEKLGFWCEDYGTYGEEDADYGNRAQLAGYANGYLPDFNLARHLEQDDTTTDYHSRKLREARRSNIERFLTNMYCYRKGIRPLRMERRYDPQQDERGITFRLNKKYAAKSREWFKHLKAVADANRDRINAYVDGIAADI